MQLFVLDGTGHTLVPEAEQAETYKELLAKGLQPMDETDPAGAVALHDKESLPTSRTIVTPDGGAVEQPIERVVMVPRMAGG